MNRSITTILAGAASALALAASAFALQDGEDDGYTVIHAGHLIAEPGDGVRDEVSIHVRDGMIERIENGYDEPDDADIVDLSDHWVLPGMIDSHVHILRERGANSRLERFTLSSADMAFSGAGNARKTMEAGFTTLQDVGADLEAIMALRRAIEAGTVVGPRLRAAGPSISPTGGHGDINGYNPDITAMFASEYACNGASDCARATRALIQNGADVIKITATGGVLSDTGAGLEVQFFEDELEAIVQAAEMMGRQVTAHAHGVSGVNAFLRAGGHSVEHGTFLDDESIDLFRENDAVLVPTVMAGEFVTNAAEDGADWMSDFQRAKALEVGPRMLEMLRRAHEGGVTVAFGTDSGVSAHGDNARELELMVEAGMSPEEVLRSATIIAAEHVQMDDEIGRIAEGFAADIIAVDGDPLEDISEMTDVDFVMARGIVRKHEDDQE